MEIHLPNQYAAIAAGNIARDETQRRYFEAYVPPMGVGWSMGAGQAG